MRAGSRSTTSTRCGTTWSRSSVPGRGLEERLATYFDLVRGEDDSGEDGSGADDEAREAYMARWTGAAVVDAGDRPVVVVTGGFHRPALIRLCGRSSGTDASWPENPVLPDGAVGGSYLVPYSFRRLDAFDGYQSGMPSPAYYQDLWDHGPQGAADRLTGAVVARLRERRQHVSTASLIAARASAAGLAMVRGHRHPARADVLDGLATTLVDEALDVPLPWASHGTLRSGTHPVVVEMVAALSGDRVGRLHPDTPLPPLVHDVEAELERLALDGDRTAPSTSPPTLGARGAAGRRTACWGCGSPACGATTAPPPGSTRCSRRRGRSRRSPNGFPR